jgi:hypothetical protein
MMARTTAICTLGNGAPGELPVRIDNRHNVTGVSEYDG